MKHVFRTLLVTFSALCLTLAPVGVAQASSVWNPFKAACSGGGGQSAVCQDSKSGGDPLTGPNSVILKTVNLLALIAGAVAVLLIIAAGLKIITSSGSSESVASARRSIIYISIGLVILLLSRTIIAFVLEKI